MSSSELANCIQEVGSVVGARASAIHSGKVREVFALPKDSSRLLMLASDRLSAFDRVLTCIPHKGAMLSELSAFWFQNLSTICPSHFVSAPFPGAMIVKRCEMLPLEIVVRGYLCGSAWRDYSAGKDVSGVSLPTGLREFDKLPEPILTPSTKADLGEHDEPISREEILSRQVVSEEVLTKVEGYAREIFSAGQKLCLERGLILVDTKYEFGLCEGEIVLADEVHTPDSSRFWVSESYSERSDDREVPKMLDKEVVRRWLLEQGYSGDGEAPSFDDDFRAEVHAVYSELFSRITQKDPPSSTALSLESSLNSLFSGL